MSFFNSMLSSASKRMEIFQSLWDDPHSKLSASAVRRIRSNIYIPIHSCIRTYDSFICSIKLRKNIFSPFAEPAASEKQHENVWLRCFPHRYYINILYHPNYFKQQLFYYRGNLISIYWIDQIKPSELINFEDRNQSSTGPIQFLSSDVINEMGSGYCLISYESLKLMEGLEIICYITHSKSSCISLLLLNLSLVIHYYNPAYCKYGLDNFSSDFQINPLDLANRDPTGWTHKPGSSNSWYS